MDMRIFWIGLIWAVLHCVDCYYSSRRCYGTGDCHLLTKNQDGGFDDANHQWLVECNDGEGAVAVRDDDSHFEGLSGLWCAFLFPLKESTRGVYPYYPTCVVRNLTAGEQHCQSQDDGTNSTQLFVSGIYKEPSSSPTFVPSLMKCCETPVGYQIDYNRCYYKKTFDRFGEHYTGEWLVKCDTHHLVTGIGKAVNPWDNKEHFTWIQCCPFYYKAEPPAASAPQPLTVSQLLDHNPIYNNFVASVPVSGLVGLSPRHETFADFTPTSFSQFQNMPPGRFSGANIFQQSKYSQEIPTLSNSYQQQSGVPDYIPNIFANHSGLYPSFSPMPISIREPALKEPQISPSQYAAVLAAYKLFSGQFNEFLQTYSKQQTSGQSGNVQLPSEYFAHGSQGSTYFAPSPSGYNYPEQGPTSPPLPLSLAAAQQTSTGYVIPPLPSGLQNFMSIASKNPGEALSKIFASADQLPYNKNGFQDYTANKNSAGNVPPNNFEPLPVFKTSTGQNYRLTIPAHYEQLRILPVAYRQQYLDYLARNFPTGLESSNNLAAWSVVQPVTTTAAPPTTTGSPIFSPPATTGIPITTEKPNVNLTLA